ncbi:RNA polymerase sigma factor [Nocardia beijingensis]|uniref:RNA polymerase sigma factor n=1 Tax=Nocardia beijingensis TaxID=95162 RepID=UPI0008368C41|nr:RNA polymerase sigma factor [Nocardia beijingensis]
MTDLIWPDEQLVSAAREGDAEAITTLVSGSYPHVRRFAHTLCASAEDAEDAAQEALIILYRKIGTLRASGALASWMFRIVRNECLRQWRTMTRPSEPIAEAAVASAEDEAVRRLEASRVASVIAALPADQRRVLIMRDVQGYSGRMVAGMLGLSVAAMKSRLHRARATVQQELRTTPWSAQERSERNA